MVAGSGGMDKRVEGEDFSDGDTRGRVGGEGTKEGRGGFLIQYYTYLSSLSIYPHLDLGVCSGKKENGRGLN